MSEPLLEGDTLILSLLSLSLNTSSNVSLVLERLSATMVLLLDGEMSGAGEFIMELEEEPKFVMKS